MPALPTGFTARVREIHEAIRGVEGFLSKREVSFLALLAACPTCEGEVLEIGSFRGRSTIVLAKANSLSRCDRVVAVDPLNVESLPGTAPTGQEAPVDRAATEALVANLKRAGVYEQVEFHQMLSSQLAKTWDRPLRLLWIDGDHSYRGAKMDFDGFAPHLNDGAILAMHDVLHQYAGCVRVFLDDVLGSPDFGAAGLCGSIGWAQYRPARNAAAHWSARKSRLAERLLALRPYQSGGKRLRGFAKLRFRYLRSRVPHGAVQPKSWLKKVA